MKAKWPWSPVRPGASGQSIALELARKGVKVIGTATSDAGAAKIREALAAFPGCDGRTLDVTDGAAGDALVDAIAKEQGGLHILVNNAGITRDTLAMRMKDDDWDAVVDTNLKGRVPHEPVRATDHDEAALWARIISITSVVGAFRQPRPSQLRGRQGRRCGHDPCAGPRTGFPQHHG